MSGALATTACINHDEIACAVAAYMCKTATDEQCASAQIRLHTIEVQDCKKANGVYELQAQVHNDRTIWKRIDGGAFYIFYSAKKEAWYLNSKLCDQGCASCQSTAYSPPLGRWDRNGLAVLSVQEDPENTTIVEALVAKRQNTLSTKSPPVSLKDLANMPVFVPAGRGRLAARGAPGPGIMGQWVAEAGTTHVVTLLREDEPAFAKVQQRACDLIKGQELRGWSHIPLSGGRCVNTLSESGRKPISKKELQYAAQDKLSLMRVGEIAELLRQGESVVVHCAAGMHRTGIVCYMALRQLGQSSVEALQSILRSRPVTHTEVTKTTSKHAPLYELAEELLSDQAASSDV